MKKMIKINGVQKIVLASILLVASLAACKKNDNTVTPDTPVVIPNALTTSYPLRVKDVLGVTGTVSFSERSSGSSETIVIITLMGAPSGTHPAHIHVNTAIETGGIAYALTSVDSVGKSTTILPVSYATLINFDGYVNVHLNSTALGTIIAQADIGGNVLTGDTKSYALVQDSASGISGKVRFDKRKNGTTLVSIDLTTGGILPLGSYPAHINLGSVSTIGTPYNKKTLQAVDNMTRKSATNVRTLDDGTPITYNNWMVYDGFVTIHDATNYSNVIAKGNIGAN